jgi:hypothetical protein
MVKMATSKPEHIVQIQIDPKTTELSAAFHGILNATKVAADKFPNANIKAINVGNDFVKVEIVGNNPLTISGDYSHHNPASTHAR